VGVSINEVGFIFKQHENSYLGLIIIDIHVPVNMSLTVGYVPLKRVFNKYLITKHRISVKIHPIVPV